MEDNRNCHQGGETRSEDKGEKENFLYHEYI